MSLYQRLRPFYQRPPEERIRIMQAELAAPLDALRRAIDELSRLSADQTASLAEGRFGELIDVLRDSMARLDTLVAEGIDRCEVARAVGGLSDQALRMYRHDLLTPLNNLRGVALLARRFSNVNLPAHLARIIGDLDSASCDVLDVIDALTSSQERDG
ncbi:MAG: histidine kinase [Roseiflexus sp.]|nr:histidine kinase [Roseiflexus sp.]MDW8146868.1 histidine kinase [Roseiflexaceae bacterium]MDW8234007.1 histidine kinase [Roseiflexaceae bacterium]